MVVTGFEVAVGVAGIVGAVNSGVTVYQAWDAKRGGLFSNLKWRFKVRYMKPKPTIPLPMPKLKNKRRVKFRRG